MKYKQKLFVYQRREIIVLVFLILLGSLFTFTLGVHMTKGLFRNNHVGKDASTELAKPAGEAAVNREELNDPGKNARQIVEDTLNQELHNEVTRTGIKIHPIRPLHLPTRTQSTEGGATHTERKESNPPPIKKLKPSAWIKERGQSENAHPYTQ